MPTTSPLPTPTPRPYAPPSGTRYVLPCHPLHHGGYYEYVLIDVAQARTWLQAGPYVSYVRHPDWAWMLGRILDDPTWRAAKRDRRSLTPLPVLDDADDALIFLPDGWDVPGYAWTHDRAHCEALVAQEGYTLGLLRR